VIKLDFCEELPMEENRNKIVLVGCVSKREFQKQFRMAPRGGNMNEQNNVRCTKGFDFQGRERSNRLAIAIASQGIVQAIISRSL
jgi:hypothetical protein